MEREKRYIILVLKLLQHTAHLLNRGPAIDGCIGSQIVGAWVINKKRKGK